MDIVLKIMAQNMTYYWYNFDSVLRSIDRNIDSVITCQWNWFTIKNTLKSILLLINDPYCQKFTATVSNSYTTYLVWKRTWTWTISLASLASFPRIVAMRARYRRHCDTLIYIHDNAIHNKTSLLKQIQSHSIFHRCNKYARWLSIWHKMSQIWHQNTGISQDTKYMLQGLR